LKHAYVLLPTFLISLSLSPGVQFFGDLHNHCVRECVENANNVTINDLTIPDTYCKQETDDSYGYDCPRCRKNEIGCKIQSFSKRLNYETRDHLKAAISDKCSV
jgi:hypothetical protein